MGQAEYIIQDLTPKQEQALHRLTSLPAPKPPALPLALLTRPPLRHQLAASAASITLSLLALVALLVWPHLNIPETWAGPMTFRTGSAVELLIEKSWTLSAPRIGGTLVLQGPASIKVQRLTRHLITGKTDAWLWLKSGELLFKASSSAPKLIQIQTPLLTVKATGTEFLISHRPQAGSRLMVIHGSVWVKQTGASLDWEMIPAGRELIVHPNGRLERVSGKTIQEQNEQLEKEASEPIFPENTVKEEEEKPAPVSADRYLWHEQD